VVAELALGTMRQRGTVLDLLNNLPCVNLATHDEVLHLAGSHALPGRGLSVVDAHLLAAVRITAGARLWTRDKPLRSAAEHLDAAAINLT
jgi:predicted nucleic acid-binding protein